MTHGSTSPAAGESRAIDQAVSTYRDVEELMREIVLSLLRSFDRTRKLFNTSEHVERKTDATSRDTAIVLTALQTAGKDVMDLRSARFKTVDEFLDWVEKAKSVDVVRYGDYERLFFECLTEIVGKEPLETLGERPDDTDPWKGRNPFTSARILMLLNLYGSEETHKGVYVEAAEGVTAALAHSYAPHYAFGGASLTGTEAHAFVSYYCIRSLRGLVDVLRARRNDHYVFATLLQNMVDWKGDLRSDLRLAYDKWTDFSPYLVPKLEPLQNSVGLTNFVRTTKDALKPSLEPDLVSLNEQLRRALKLELQWIADFLSLVQQQVDRIKKELAPKLREEITRIETGPRMPVGTMRPGEGSMKAAHEYFQWAGLNWGCALFEGMVHVLQRIAEEYKKAERDRGDLKTLAQTIRSVGEKWSDSALLTDAYVSKFSKWATAEVHRQLALYHVRFQTNFDPIQLAFALRIHHDLAEGANPKLVERSLKLLAKSQQPNGTWPAGAPLVFDRGNLSALEVANIEVINVLMPLFEKYGGLQHHSLCFDRVYNWLITNKREITSYTSRNKVSGWTTDRVLEHGRVDVWATALTLEFLSAYRRLLQDFINRSITHERYSSQDPVKLLAWTQMTDPQYEADYAQRVTTKIYERFIRPFRETGKGRQTSMILYGPPGTAKTTIVGAIANELGWRLVTITPSDFVKEGIERSEHLARQLFQDLLKLKHVVVLFDEIDEMLRTRLKTEGVTGIAMLQFIVPGMLPKLQELKQYGEKEGLIFVVATNYRERLDPAIVRPGRIDESFLVLPPDLNARRHLMDQMLKRRDYGDGSGDSRALVDRLAEWTAGWGIKELDTLIDKLDVDEVRGADKAEFLAGAVNDLKGALKAEELEKGNAWAGWRILGLERALNPTEVYRDRPEAREEAKAVLQVCWQTADDDQLKRRLDTILPPQPK